MPTALLVPFLAWVALTVDSAMGGQPDAFGVAAAFGVLVAQPLALRIDADVPAWLRGWTAVAGLVACASLLVPVGTLAGALAAAWMTAVLPGLAYGFVRFLSDPEPRRPFAWAEAASAVGPVVAAAALFGSRSGLGFAGFPEPLAILTVAHFEVTFGLLPLALSALARAGFAAEAPLWGIVAVPVGVGALFAFRREPAVPTVLEGVGVGVLAVWVLAWTAASWGRMGKLGRLATPARVAALLLTAGVGLAPAFSLGLALAAPRLDYADMLRWHGVGNALACVVLGGIAATAARMRGVTGSGPAPDLSATVRDVAPERALFRDARTFDLGSAADGRFDRLADALLAYRFYPEDVMIAVTTFGREGRPARVGDRVGMCLLVPLFPGLPAARFPATTEVHVAERGPGHAAFGYRTTTSHYGRGAWCARIVERDGHVILTIESRMLPSHPLALLGLPIYRGFQKRAHRRGAANLGSTS